MPPSEILKIANQICHPIYSASNALMRIYKPLLEPLKLTYPQYLIMLVLWEKDGINIQSISQVTYFDSGTLTPLIRKLKKTGYIDLSPDPDDSRSKIVRLTKNGKQLKHKALSVIQSVGCALFFNSQDPKELKKMAEKLYQGLVAFESSISEGRR